LEHGDLLAEGQHLESGVAPPGKENAQCGKDCKDGLDEHEPTLLTRRNVGFRGAGDEIGSA
jgi:hypothetical protein